MGLLNLLFGNKKKTLKYYKTRGAIIIDVRTPTEYRRGAIKGSKNIPLQQINSKIRELKEINKPIITCCASGIRSAKATAILKNHDIESVNGGGWMSLKKFFNQ